MYIYENDFDPLNPYQNTIFSDKQRCMPDNIVYTVYLRSRVTYILLVTTLNSLAQTSFLIDAYGPANISFRRFSAYS